MAGRLASHLHTSPAVKCMQILLTVFNLIFWAAGIAILAMGIWTKVQLYMYMELSGVYNGAAAWTMIGVGAGIVIITTLGCCCTIKGASHLLYIYAAFLVLVFIADLAVSISAFIYRGKVEDGFRTGLPAAMNNFATNEEDRNAINGLQQNLHCCGNNSYEDWHTIKWDGQRIAKDQPPSCYKDVNEKSTLYEEGCYTKVSKFLKQNFVIIGGVAIGFSFLELFGALIACCLAKNINKAKYEQVA